MWITIGCKVLVVSTTSSSASKSDLKLSCKSQSRSCGQNVFFNFSFSQNQRFPGAFAELHDRKHESFPAFCGWHNSLPYNLIKKKRRKVTLLEPACWRTKCLISFILKSLNTRTNLFITLKGSLNNLKKVLWFWFEQKSFFIRIKLITFLKMQSSRFMVTFISIGKTCLSSIAFKIFV